MSDNKEREQKKTKLDRYSALYHSDDDREMDNDITCAIIVAAALTMFVVAVIALIVYLSVKITI